MPEISQEDLDALNAAKKASEELKTKHDAMTKEFEALKLQVKPPPESPDLKLKAEQEQKDREKRVKDDKRMEAAVRFTYDGEKFLKDNASILPKSAGDIFVLANKETYDSVIEKTASIKSGLISAVFDIQSNMDMLTSSQKESVEEFKKLTKKARDEQAEQIYSTVLEPHLATLRAVAKAQQIAKSESGYGDSPDHVKAYADKLIRNSKKHYLGVSDGA